uniref:Pentatricopeptide repeat-containing protein n=1 Tax=Kalanchoe fedtschenkoi TaxID=63787 RepID=A0A7N0T6R1_KALFE
MSMKRSGWDDASSFQLLSLIKECQSLRDAKHVHTHLISSPSLSNSNRHLLLTRLLFRCALSEWACPAYAGRLFRSIPTPDLYAYNVMIRASASRRGDDDDAFKLYKRMTFHGITPDFISFPFVFKKCAGGTGTAPAHLGRSLHAQAITFGVTPHIYTSNSLITFYASHGFSVDALRVFDEMPHRDVVSWNSIIIGCLRCGGLDRALALFRQMTYPKNIITWNSIIIGFVQGGKAKEALDLFHEMQSGDNDSDVVRPDNITFANVITACATVGAIDHGRWVHTYLKKSDVLCDCVIQTALVDMYGKCGCLDTAVEVFRNMCKKDIFAWTAMISVFALHGRSEEAFDLFDEMISLGVKPNQVTFVALLSACAHSGLIDKGRLYFHAMSPVYSLEPQAQHYACMVDMLSRSGKFEEVQVLIKGMPMPPDAFVLGAILGGCQMHRNVKLGAKVAQLLIDLEPLNHVFYVNLIDIYAKASRHEDVKRIRNLMNERGIRKEIAGCSMVEIDGIVYEFSISGSPDVKLKELIQVLDVLYSEFRNTRINTQEAAEK